MAQGREAWQPQWPTCVGRSRDGRKAELDLSRGL